MPAGAGRLDLDEPDGRVAGAPAGMILGLVPSVFFLIVRLMPGR